MMGLSARRRLPLRPVWRHDVGALGVQSMKSNRQVSARGLATSGCEIADGRGLTPNPFGDLDVCHTRRAQVIDSLRPDVHVRHVTVFRNLMSTAFRNAFPLQ